jgi:hypothetical protein
MEHREYQAPTGFVIDSIVIRCVHCNDKMKPSEASSHKLSHAIERSRAQNRKEGTNSDKRNARREAIARNRRRYPRR